MSPRPDGEAGFTLIETLVALTLTVGILAAIATLTAQWLPNWNRGIDDLQRKELLGRALERIVADISAAQVVTANGKSKEVLFRGSELSISFVRTAVGPNTRPGLEFVRIVMTADKDGPALVRARSPYLILPPGLGIDNVSNFTEPVVLMRAPYRALFAYAGPDLAWRNVWTDREHLPTAVRFSILDTATETISAASTAMILHVDVAAACVRDKDPVKCIYGKPKQGNGL